jgi:hypothetical protein
MLFVVRNTHLYITNQETRGVNIRHNADFHFPTDIKILSNRIELFKPALKKYLLQQFFYSLEEYFSYSS